MSERPPVTAALAAAIVAAAPARLVKKLDAAPRLAEGWSWSTSEETTTVVTDGGERVVLARSPIASLEGVRCTCLLSPRCLHVLAVIAALPIDEAHASPSAPRVEKAAEKVVDARPVARQALAALGRALERGLAGLGAIERGELLRVVHAARVAGLHRLAARTLSFVEAARAAREGSADFDLGEAARVLGDALRTAHRLERGDVSIEAIGVARRAYEPIGSLRVVGVACEPVATRSGYAGIVTHVAAEGGALYTVSDVVPGDAERALAAYEATVRLGEASLSHAELARAALLVQNATASVEGRLGAGRGVSAVSAEGASFFAPPLDALFGEPLAAQLAAGRALVFAEGALAGSERDTWLDCGGARPLPLVAPTDDPRFAARENLRILGRAGGARVRVVGKPRGSRAGTVVALACSPCPGEDRLALPAALEGRVQLAYDTLTRAAVRAAGASGTLSVAELPALDPLAALGRRTLRIALGGRRTLTTSAAAEVGREADALERALMPTAAGALRALLVAATGASSLAPAWLAARTVEEVVARDLAVRRWRAYGPTAM
jgi:hypothetical protein